MILPPSEWKRIVLSDRVRKLFCIFFLEKTGKRLKMVAGSLIEQPSASLNAGQQLLSENALCYNYFMQDSAGKSYV